MSKTKQFFPMLNCTADELSVNTDQISLMTQSYHVHCRRTLWCKEHYMVTKEVSCWGGQRKEPLGGVHRYHQTISHRFWSHHVACLVHGLWGGRERRKSLSLSTMTLMDHGFHNHIWTYEYLFSTAATETACCLEICFYVNIIIYDVLTGNLIPKALQLMWSNGIKIFP